MNKRIFVFILISTLLSFAPVWAHKEHHSSQTQTETAAQSQTQTGAIAGAIPATTQEKSTSAENEPLPPMTDFIMEHMHNKIVHFPVAFGIAGVFFIFLASKWPQYESSAKVMWLLGGILAVAAYFTGIAQEKPFHGTNLAEILELHEKLGISTAISLWTGFAILMLPKLKRFGRLWAIIVLVLISVTAFYGGVLAHAD